MVGVDTGRTDDTSDNTRDDTSIEEAAVVLGMSPNAVIHLLESGRLASHLGPDGRRRRILSQDLETHRDVRFTLRQARVQEQRARRWAEPEPDELVG
jgi:excisionase family DNA binding protein